MQPFLRKSIALVPWRWRGTVKRIPLVATFQRWLLARFLEGREFVHTVDAGPARGLKYPITLPQDKGIWTGTYEMELAAAVATAVRQGDVCYDVGGWRGFFGGVMALAGAEHVFLFEPLPANVAQLRKLISLNPELPLSLIEAAVTEQPGELEFVVMPETSMGKLTSSSFQSEKQSDEKIRVRAVALDALLASGEIPPPAVIKIDVEGAELLVLHGAQHLLATHKPKLFMEIHSPELVRACRSLLERAGYEVQVFKQDGREICHFHAEPRTSWPS
ncbi:MAG: FkbM family methyltransferase [Verrucomicrobia bacterium]|nr:FkbM family methyltransferase [Verrucomicrobiota bacterium]